ncbi:hypothetical protein PAMP_022870 [Pampus punctatissimus]
MTTLVVRREFLVFTEIEHTAPGDDLVFDLAPPALACGQLVDSLWTAIPQRDPMMCSVQTKQDFFASAASVLFGGIPVALAVLFGGIAVVLAVLFDGIPVILIVLFDGIREVLVVLVVIFGGIPVVLVGRALEG